MKRFILFMLLWTSLLLSCSQATYEEVPISDKELTTHENSPRSDEEPILVIDPHGHSAMINDVMFTPDGKTLVSISDDKTICVWDVETGGLIKTIRGQIGDGSEGSLYSGAFSPDGKTLAVGGHLDPEGGGIQLFNLDTGEQTGLLAGHTDRVNDLAFLQDGKWLVSGSDDETVRIWEISGSADVTPVLSPIAILEGHSDSIDSVAFSPDGTRVVSAAGDDIIILWDWQNRKIVKKWEDFDVVTYSPDGSYIVSGAFGGEIVLWDGNGNLIKEIDTLPNNIGAISFSADSQKIVVTDEVTGKVYVFSIPDGERIMTFTKHSSEVFVAAFHENRTIATAGFDPEIYIWDAISGAVKTHIASKGKTVWAIAFRQDQGEGLNIAFGNTLHYTSDLHRGPLEKSFNFSEMSLNRNQPDESEFRRVQMEYQGKTLEYINEYELRITNGGTIKNSSENQGEIRSYTFTKDGDVVVGNFFTLNLHQNDGTLFREFTGHTGQIFAVSVSADGRILASASNDQTIKLWNINTGEYLATLFVATDNEWICWTPQGYYAASAGGEKYVGWHLNQGMNKAAKYYPVSVFRKRFHRPELVKRTIAVGSFEQALNEINAESQQKIEETTITQVLPPKVQWISPEAKTVETSEPFIRIHAKIQSESKLTTVKILVNGRTQTTGRGLVIADENLEIEDEIDREISLVPGKNEITIFAANEHAGSTSTKRLVVYRSEAHIPNLYVVSVGISQYHRNDLNLEYADDDAKAISQVFRGQEDKLYNNVIIKELYDQDATQDRIIEALEWLKAEVTQKDVVLIFIAAHGTNEQGRYYLLPADGNPGELERTGISWRDFSESLGNLPSRVLLFLDTCHSGQLGRDVLAKTQQIDNTEAIRELSSEEYGVVILAASTGREFSVEHSDWGHGAFTKALIEALEQGQADYSKDGVINLRELDMYVADRVEALTDNQQHPTTQKPSTISRFPIVQGK